MRARTAVAISTLTLLIISGFLLFSGFASETIAHLASIGLLFVLVLAIILLGSILLRPIRLTPSPKRSRTIDPFRKADEADEFLRRARERTRRQMDNLHDGNDN